LTARSLFQAAGSFCEGFLLKMVEQKRLAAQPSFTGRQNWKAQAANKKRAK